MYNQITQNKRNTTFLLAAFVSFFMLMGYLFGYIQSGNREQAFGLVGVFGIVAIVYALISYFSAGRLTLAISHATEIKKQDQPELYRVVENLCIASGLPLPKVYLIEDTALNAFATGRDPAHAAIAVTRGLLEKLEKPELEGVIAHELSHIQNYDIRIQCITVALIGLIALVSDMFLRSMFYRRLGGSRQNRSGGALLLIGFLLALLSPIIARLIHLAISREREYLADAAGSMLTRHPEGLAKALEKIAADKEPLEVANKATAHLYIENPLRNEHGMRWLNGLFSTHPDVQDRIQRLRQMGV